MIYSRIFNQILCFPGEKKYIFENFNVSENNVFCLSTQALMLAAFKPMIDVKHLLHNLRRVQEITNDALQFFNGTRLLPLFYEDLLNSPSVSS